MYLILNILVLGVYNSLKPAAALIALIPLAFEFEYFLQSDMISLFRLFVALLDTIQVKNKLFLDS